MGEIEAPLDVLRVDDLALSLGQITDDKRLLTGQIQVAELSVDCLPDCLRENADPVTEMAWGVQGSKPPKK